MPAGGNFLYNSSLQDSSPGESFNFGSLNGVRGFFTDPSKADDSFVPFKKGNDTLAVYSKKLSPTYSKQSATGRYAFAVNGAKKITYSSTKPSNSGGVSLAVTLYDNTYEQSIALPTITSAATQTSDIPEGYDFGFIEYTAKHSGNSSHVATANHTMNVVCE